MDRWDELAELLRQIQRNQEKALLAHEKQLALTQSELERSQQRIKESVELQRLAVDRQAQVRNIVLPLIVLLLFLIGYLIVKYRMF